MAQMASNRQEHPTKTIHLAHILYFASFSRRTLGSNVLCSPSNVLLTASLAPIIGFKTAIGTARMTERTGPYEIQRLEFSYDG